MIVETQVKLRLIALIAFLALLLPAQQEKLLTVYSPQVSYSVAVVERDGREYVGVLDLLQPLGAASARQDGDTWKVRFNSAEAEFKPGKQKAKVGGKTVKLGAPVLQDKQRALIPLASVAPVLSQLSAMPAAFHEGARRLFLGNVGTQFSAELEKTPPKLVLRFTAPVNPTIATEPGRLRMIFTREPLLAPASLPALDDKLITGASFAERNGAAELTIAAGAPLMATFSDEGRTITISAVPALRAQAAPPPAVPGPPAVAPPAPAAPAPAPLRPRPVVVIDPAHGGDDRGAILADNLAEKDVTLAWARRLRAALERHGIAVILLRDSDAALTSDERAALANAAHPAAFISLHAGAASRAVRIYTAHLPDTTRKPGAFLPWDTAQASFLDSSRSLAGSIAEELSKRNLPVSAAPVLMRPLNNLAAAAIAVEVTATAAEVLALLAPEYQQSICAALADGIAATPARHAAAVESH